MMNETHQTDTPPQQLQLRMVLVPACVFVVSAILLKVLGQPVSCKCRSWSLWSGDVWSTHNSQHLFDPYALTHVLHGVLFCGLLWLLPKKIAPFFRLLICVLIEAVWEVFENTPFVIERYRTATMSLDYYGDSIVNSFGDNLSCLLGYLLAMRFGLRKSIVFFVVTELVLLFWIRDCLTLNIVMLLHPIEAIKQWQMSGQGL
ncbi:MAG: DUF2585 family protein [Planctomycetaceae bacterium]